MLSFDERYQREREERRAANKPRHAAHGVFLGGMSVARGILGGVSGLVTEPVRGARSEGVAGAFKGVGRGLVGVAVKPVVGVVDMTSDITAGVKNTTAIDIRRPTPRRWPRACGSAQTPLESYSEKDALARILLHSTDRAERDTIVASFGGPASSNPLFAPPQPNERVVAAWCIGADRKRVSQARYTHWLVISDARVVSSLAKDVSTSDPAQHKYFHG